MNKYISFGLWGGLPKYCEGAVRNVALAKTLYPEWRCVFWVNGTVPPEVIVRLVRAGAVIRVDEFPWCNRMFDRFTISDDPSCERFIIRDADSRLNERERASVLAWESSGKAFLSQRDHPAHAREINGGLWGGTGGVIPSMAKLIEDSGPGDQYGDDQDFLVRHVYPLVRHDWLQHDSVSRHLFPGSIPFPTKRKGSCRFVGEVWEIGDNGEDIPRERDIQFIDPWKD